MEHQKEGSRTEGTTSSYVRDPVNLSPKKAKGPRKHLSNKQIFVLAGIVVFLALLTFFTYGAYRDTSEQATITHAPSASEQADVEYEKLRHNPVAESASPTEKTSYYQELSAAAEGAGEYQAAVDAFKQREGLLGGTMAYYEYYTLALYWCRLEKPTEFNQAIDQAVTRASIDPALSAEQKQEIKSNGEDTKKEGCTEWLTVVDNQ